MPRYETNGYGVRLATDRTIPTRPGYCSESLGAALGFSLGDANQAGGALREHGWTPRPQGHFQAGDVVQYMHYGKPGSRGWTYGHIGIAARNTDTGEMGFLSNLSGVRKWMPLSPNARLYAPPPGTSVGTFNWSGPRGNHPPPAYLNGPLTQTAPDFNIPSLPEAPQDQLVPELPQVQVPSVLDQQAQAQPMGGLTPTESLEAVRSQFEKWQGPQVLPGPPVGEPPGPTDTSIQTHLDEATAALQRAAEAPAAKIERVAGIAATGIEDLTTQLIRSPLVQEMAKDFVGFGLGMGEHWYLSPVLGAFHQAQNLVINKVVRPTVEEGLKFAIGGAPAFYAAISDAAENAKDIENSVQPQPTLGELFGQRMATESVYGGKGYSWADFVMERGGFQQPGQTPTQASMAGWVGFSVGALGDMYLSPLAYGGFGVGTEVAGAKNLNAAMTKAGVTLAAEHLPGANPLSVQTVLSRFLADAGKVGLRDALEQGGKVVKPYFKTLGNLLTQEGPNAVRATKAEVDRFIPELMARWRYIQRSPMHITLPYDLAGFPVPKAAVVRDRIKLGLGLPTTDFRLANDPALRGMRQSLKERFATTFGFTPIVPLESEEAAYLHSLRRRLSSAYHRKYRQGATLVEDGEFEGASRAAESRRFREAAIQEKQAGTGREELRVKAAPSSGRIAETWRWLHGVVEGELKERQGQTTSQQVLHVIQTIVPDIGIPRYFQRGLRQAELKAEAWMRTITPTIEHTFAGLDNAARPRLWRYANEEMTGPMRMHDLLVGTGEVTQVIPGAAETRRAFEVAEAARVRIATIGEGATDPRLIQELRWRAQEEYLQLETAYKQLWTRDHNWMKENYFAFGNRIKPSGKVVRELVVDRTKLAEVAPQAAQMDAMLEVGYRELAQKLMARDKPNVAFLQKLGFDVVLREVDNYTPRRMAREIAEFLDTVPNALEKLGYGKLPAGVQPFMQARKGGAPQSKFVDMVEAAMKGESRPFYEGGTQHLPPFLTDIESLWHIRAYESAELQRRVDIIKMLQWNAIHISDKGAPEALRMGFQPFVRMAGREGFSVLREGRIAEGQAKNATTLAKVLSRADQAEEMVVNAKQALQDLRATGGPEVIAEGEKLLQLAETTLQRVQARETRLRKGLAHSGLQMPEGIGRGFDPDLIEWLVPPTVASEYVQSPVGRVALGLRILNRAIATNYVRGTVLMSPAFHVFNLVDNWVVAPWLGGSAFMLRDKGALTLYGNAGAAARAIVHDAFANWPWLEQEAVAGRLAKWTEGSLGWIGKGHYSEEQIATLARELRENNIIGTGLYGMGASASKVKAMALHNANRQVGQLLEDIPRAATFAAARQRGYSILESKRVVDSMFVNYGHNIRAPFDNLMRETTLFWPYTRVRTEQVLTAFFRRPWRLVLFESLQNRAMGQRANLSFQYLPGHQLDIPLGLAPDSENMGLASPAFSKSDRYAITHLPWRYNRLRQGWIPMGTPLWDPTTGEADTDNVSEWILKQVLPHRGPDSPTNIMRAQRGRYLLFMRGGLSPLEIIPRTIAMMSGDQDEIVQLMNPILQLALPQENEKEGSTLPSRLGSRFPRLVTAYVPFARLAEPAMTAAIRPPSEANLAERGPQYWKEQTALRQRQGYFRFMGMSFTAIPLEDVVNGMGKDEKAQYWQLKSKE